MPRRVTRRGRSRATVRPRTSPDGALGFPRARPRGRPGEAGVNCEVVALGTELLLGQIVDTNSSWIGEQLAMAGIDSHFQTKVGDNHARIVSCIRLALERSNAVIMCGGLGPTQD